MRVSEIFVSIINISGILIGIAAATYGLISYIQTYSHAKSIRIGTIGRLNLVIFVSMVIIILSVYVLPDASNTYFIVHSTLVGTLLIGLFIVFQTFYLFSPRSPAKYLIPRINNNNQTSLSTKESIGDFERSFRDYLLNDLFLQSLQIFNMSFPLKTTEIYIPTKVYPEPLQLSAEQINSLEEQFTPLDLLNEKSKILERRIDGAKDPLQIFTYKKHCILLGEPGIGKTTFLKFLTVSLAGPREDLPKNLQFLYSREGTSKVLLPLFIKLNDYANNPNLNLLDYIIDYYRKRYFSHDDETILRVLIKDKLKDGSLFLLLDGLDETHIGKNAKQTYKDVCDSISHLAGKYENAHIIVTSRKASYELRQKLIVSGKNVRGNEFEKLEIAGFIGDDICTFVGHWLNEIPSDDKENLTKTLLLKLKQDSRLRELSNNPLLLSIITLACSRRLNITHRRAKLYEECTSALLRDWDKSRIIVRTNEEFLAIQNELPEMTKTLLKELAWYFHKCELSYFPRAEVLKLVKVLLEQNPWHKQLDPEQILDEIIINSGLIQKIWKDKRTSEDKKISEDYYCFSHITFQEYFAAKYMIDCVQCNEKSEIDFLNNWRNPWWEEAIRLYAGLTPKLDSVLNFLITSDNKDIYYSNIFFAGRCIAATSIDSGDAVKKVIEELFIILKQTDNKQLAFEAAKTLVEIDHESINDELLRILIDSNIELFARTSIADALGASSDGRVPGMLRDWVFNVQGISNNTLCSSIIYTLGKLGDKSVAGDLVKNLSQPSQNGDKEQLHISIIDALRSLREPSVIPNLCDNLNSNKVNDYEKSRIAETLGVLSTLIDTQDMKDRLSKTLFDVIYDQRTSIDVRSACIGTFGRWCYTPSIPKLQDFLKTLSETKEQNKQEYIRNWPLRSRITVVLNLLGETPTEPDVPTLLLEKNVDLTKNIKSRKNADIEKNLGEPLSKFLQFLVDQNANSLTPTLVPLIFQEDGASSIVRIELAKALGKIGDEKAAEQLSRYIVDKDKVQDLDRHVCSKVVLTLGELCNKGILNYEELIRVLHTFLADRNTDIDILRSCAEVISRIGTLEDRLFARDRLLGVVQDVREQRNEHPLHIQSYQIISGTLGDETVLDQLKELLLKDQLANQGNENATQAERKRIVKALIIINNPSTVPYLLKNLRDTTDTTLSLDIHRSIVKVIKGIATDADTCKILWDVMKQVHLPVLEVDIYEAVWEISRREELRVFWDSASSSIQVEKVKPLELELPTTAGSQV